MKNIVKLNLDGYQDLFSDFDPRPYSERGLSDDFLHELKNAVREVSFDGFEIIFSLPVKERKTEIEKIIVERLHSHFKKHDLLLMNEKRSLVKSGILLTIFGLIVMSGSMVVSWYADGNRILDLIRVVLEPGGWFMSWYGLDEVFYLSRKKNFAIDFYHKATKAKIVFENLPA